MLTTVRHMADAISYLMRVAVEAKLHDIARKLADVRDSLVNIASEDPGSGNPAKIKCTSGSQNEISNGESYDVRNDS